MRITKWGEYGILCSLYLVEKLNTAQDNDAEKSPSEAAVGAVAIGANEISEELAIPIQYTQQILQRLRKGGIITSIRGPKGGYQLSKDAHEISLKDVLYAAEGHTFEVICDTQPISLEACAADNFCGLKDVWYELKDTVDSFLAQKSLAEIAKHHSVRFRPNISEELVQLQKDPS